MRPVWLGLFALAAQAQSLTEVLARVSEEAEVYRQMAPNALAEETLWQKAVVVTHRGRPQMLIQTREIVSEYSVGAMKEAPGAPHEFRQVVSVDGRKLRDAGKARHALSLGLNSPQDRLRKHMLEDFERHGLVGAVTDLGPLVLLFTRRRLGDYSFEPVGQETLGADRVVAIHYRQTGGSQNITVFEGRKVVREPLDGVLFTRQSDGLPLRITLRTARKEGSRSRLDEAAVEYVRNPHGFMAPAAALHRQFVDGQLVVENRFRYTPFRVFSANTEIKFTELPEMPQ
jgi:hypothetical protein